MSISALMIIIITYLSMFTACAITGAKHRVIVSGATGYIGRNVVRELVRRGIPTAAIIRSTELSPITAEYLTGSTLLVADVSNPASVVDIFQEFKPTSSICCLASRSGVRRDSWNIDYLASSNTLNALAKLGQGHFVLLSAFCVAKPELQFQLAKLKLEEEIRCNEVLSHSIVRPTAFFKSVDGQVESVRKGNPILYFGDGTCAANAISATDLAEFLCDCALDAEKIGMKDATRSIGGPDVPPITKREQGNLIYDALNVPVDNRTFIALPLQIFDALIGAFSILQNIFSLLGMDRMSERFDDASEIARIVRYYASEPMVATGDDQIQGKVKLKDHFAEVAARGGFLEEIDPMTTTAGVLGQLSNNLNNS